MIESVGDDVFREPTTAQAARIPKAASIIRRRHGASVLLIARHIKLISF
jgi:hypothetical protein